MEDQDQDGGQYESRTKRRPIRPLPARRASGGAKTVPHFDSIQTQEQDYDPRGNIGSQEDATDENADDDMTDVDDLADDLNSGEANGSVEDLVEEDVEEDVTPVIRQETDLERHRRLTRELLGEEDDFFFRPESNRLWSAPLFIPSHHTE